MPSREYSALRGNTVNDLHAFLKLYEKSFNPSSDSTQIPCDLATAQALEHFAPGSINVAYLGLEPVGFAFGVPCSDSLRGKFFAEKLTERQVLDEALKSTEPRTAFYFSTIYLESAARGHGIAPELAETLFSRHISPSDEIFCFIATPDGEKFISGLKKKYSRISTRPWPRA